MKTLVMRWRGRIALRLLEPFLLAETAKCYAHSRSGDKPMSYHQDWWTGGYFALTRLHRAASLGEVAAEVTTCCSCTKIINPDEEDEYLDQDGAVYHEGCYQP